MFDLDNWQEIWATITRNKVRSVLTGFGVFWGIFMLIILIGVGNSLTGGVMKQVDGFASNSCFFWPQSTSEPYEGYRIGRWWSMNSRDIVMLRDKARSVEYLSPMLYGGTSDKNVVRGHKSGTYSQRGVYPEHFRIEQMQVLHGRLLNDIDTDMKRKVCVIGKEVYETLFDVGEDPVGKYIRVNGIYFQVVGVVRGVSNISMGGDVTKQIYLPFTTMRHMFSRGDNIYFLACTAKKGYRAAQVIEEVSALIKAAHHISPTDDKALSTFNIENEFLRFTNLFAGVNILIWIVGLGALFSGIIGISNIMLVTVRERMREIGVRRALGATPRVIMTQILSESFVLTAIAGLGGLIFGVLVLMGISAVMSVAPTHEGEAMFIPPLVSFGTAMAALAILVASGLVAGILPTVKALKIKAIDAIRDE